MLTEEDAIKFYEMLNRYNKLSPNIAVLGSYKRFKSVITKLKLKCKLNRVPVKLNQDKTKLSIMYNDEVINYIHVELFQDMTGLCFRKFI